jgi:hypothetical protein
MALVEYSDFGVQENFDRPNQPMLLLVLSNDGYAIHFLLMGVNESSVLFEGLDIFPTL